MYYKDVGYLCQEVISFDSYNKPQKTFSKNLVFCNFKGVKRNEFYQAMAQGIKPELCIELKEINYNQESYFEYHGIMYRIIKTYPVKNECLELVCTKHVVGGG